MNEKVYDGWKMRWMLSSVGSSHFRSLQLAGTVYSNTQPRIQYGIFSKQLQIPSEVFIRHLPNPETP